MHTFLKLSVFGLYCNFDRSVILRDSKVHVNRKMFNYKNYIEVVRCYICRIEITISIGYITSCCGYKKSNHDLPNRFDIKFEFMYLHNTIKRPNSCADEEINISKFQKKMRLFVFS